MVEKVLTAVSSIIPLIHTIIVFVLTITRRNYLTRYVPRILFDAFMGLSYVIQVLSA